MNYQVINSNMFVVPGGQGNFKAMHNSGGGGKEQEAVEQMAQGIYSLFKSINKVPLVRVSAGDISDKIFKKLSALYC